MRKIIPLQPSLPEKPELAEDKTVNDPSRLGYFASVVMLMTILSRLLGFLRDVIFAQIFGATAAFDAFVIAFKIPDFMRRLFGEGAFSQAFIPVLAEYRAKKGTEGVAQLINGMTAALGVIFLAVVLLGEMAAPLLVMIFAPGFADHPERYQLATHLLRITFPYLFSIAMAALAAAVLNAYYRFTLTAFAPVLFNILLIIVAVIWAPRVKPVEAVVVLAWGITLSGVAQLTSQWLALQHLGFMPKPILQGRHEGVSRALKQTIPALLGVSVAQICLLIDNMFASFLPVGSISWLYYSDRLLYFPLGVIGVALVTVVMPQLSQHHHRERRANFGATTDWALRWVFVTAIPAALGLGVLSEPILATLMRHGAFNAYDLMMTRRSLMAFSLGLPALMAIKIFAAAFYAQHNVRTPARIAGFALLFNVIFNFILILPLAHAGLALSTSLASWFNALLLWVFLRRYRIFESQRGWLRLSMGVVLGSVLMTTVLWFGRGAFSDGLAWTVAESGLRLAALIGLGMVLYLLGLWSVGLRWHHFKSRILCN